MSTVDRLTLVVAKRVEETEDILSVELTRPEGGELPPFDAGAHVDVHVRDGLVRQYSLCNSPAERHRYRLGILKAQESRGGSSHLHMHLAEGTRLEIGRPRNVFRLREDTRYALLIAGGIGITPLLSMAYRLHAIGTPFELHYCVKSRDKAAFRVELAACPFHSRVVLHCDDGPPQQRLGPEVFADRDAADVYLCGPDGFMDWVTKTAVETGLSPERIHSERFAASGAKDTSGTASFTVTAARSGITVTVDGTTTILDAFRNRGVDIPVSCEQGICGTCLTRVVEGVPDHHDLYQTDSEKAANTHMTPCCSRSKSAVLVLDL
jgi:vanillate O-demethylase ferredoxin subunit